MATNTLAPPTGFDDLPIEEQIAFVESLWDSIAARPEQVSVPDWHQKILAERLAERPTPTREWNDVRDEIRAKFSRSSSH
jgi:putative addiction module component (TIGR02574 family)